MDYKQLLDQKNAIEKRKPFEKHLGAILALLSDTPFAQEIAKALFYKWFPAYFFEVPSSSTGKYHPAFANRADGLLLHSVAVARNVDLMFPISDIPARDRWKLIVAAWAHDMLKYGDPKDYKPGCYTTHDHPVLAAGFFRDPGVQAAFADEFGNAVIEDMGYIARVIETHMGKWTTSKYSDVILRAPEARDEILLHTADYIASRKESDIVSDLL